MFTLNRSGTSRAINIWPGFVDALSALLMVVIFVLMVFMVAQFYLSTTLSGRDEQVLRLTREVRDLTTSLELERGENADLRARVSRLTGEVGGLIGERDTLTGRLGGMESERDSLAQRLAEAIERNRLLNDEGTALNDQLLQALEAIDASRETAELQLRQIASLQADIEALRSARESLELEVASLGLAAQAAAADAERLGNQLGLTTEELLRLRQLSVQRDETLTAQRTQIDQLGEQVSGLEAQVGAVTVELRMSEADRDRLMAELAALRDRSLSLESRLSEADERTVLAQRRIEERDVRIDQLIRALDTTEAALDEEQALTRDQRDELAALTEELRAVRQQARRLESALRESEATVAEQDVEIANLDARLNQALLRRVEELNRYRSEFFGRLRQVLGDQPGVRIEGDRFVFQSEVLFDSGSARLEPGGREQLAEFASTLLAIAAQFPEDIDWILRVDGHTDRRPIVTAEFPSNWELSTARATEVVRYLESQGVPPDRLAAAGFGEFQPIVEGDSAQDYARNRRIELRLDQR